MEGESEKQWTCTFCTYKNRTRNAPTTCDVCGNKRVFAAKTHPPMAPPSVQSMHYPLPRFGEGRPSHQLPPQPSPQHSPHFSSPRLDRSHSHAPHLQHNSSPSIHRHHSSSRGDLSERLADRETEKAERHREREREREREKEVPHRESTSSSRNASPAPSLVSSAAIPGRHRSISREPTNERERLEPREAFDHVRLRESQQLPQQPPDFIHVSLNSSVNSPFAAQPLRRNSHSNSVRRPHLTKEEKEKAREEHKEKHQHRMQQRREEKEAKANANPKRQHSAVREAPVMTEEEKLERASRQLEMRAKLHKQVKLMQEQEQQRFEQAQRANPIRQTTYADKIEELKRLREERRRSAKEKLNWQPSSSSSVRSGRAYPGDEIPNVSDESGTLGPINPEEKAPLLPGKKAFQSLSAFHNNNTTSNSNVASIFDLPSDSNLRNNSNGGVKNSNESLRNLKSPSSSNSNASSHSDLARSNPLSSGSDPVSKKELKNRVHVFVYNLPLPVDTQAIHEYFGGATIKKIDYKTNIYDEYLGSCVIEYYEAAAAQDALLLDGEFLGDSELIVVEEDLENEDMAISQSLENMRCTKLEAVLEVKNETAKEAKPLPESLVATVDNSSSSSDDDAPPYPLSFACPITNELMSDPVIVIESRMVYERVAIEMWFSKRSTDPMTNVELTSKLFIPVLAFKEAIEEWKEMHNYRED